VIRHDRRARTAVSNAAPNRRPRRETDTDFCGPSAIEPDPGDVCHRLACFLAGRGEPAGTVGVLSAQVARDESGSVAATIARLPELLLEPFDWLGTNLPGGFRRQDWVPPSSFGTAWPRRMQIPRGLTPPPLTVGFSVPTPGDCCGADSTAILLARVHRWRRAFDPPIRYTQQSNRGERIFEQRCALAPDLESILRARMSIIVFRQHRP
jgi:hypothetical protein